ncbi:hypothetical protein ACOMCU_11615 [Lysinibacillus sp. UGB7]|uniref:hypothetical protein n=1 Tax=Lysinibacillus sp. UGB7 TaxID=3411039 RepID=UPI003B827402
MRCLCEQQVTFELKVEGDIGADPIWCDKCSCNFDIEKIPLSIELKSELMEWVWRYGKWIDWSNDGIFPNGIELEDEHNKQGVNLTEKVRKELEGKYKVAFSPSTFARRHAVK